MNLTLEQMAAVIKHSLEMPEPVALIFIGKFGVGKTAVARAASLALGRENEFLALGRIEPMDVKGLPDLSADFMTYKKPEYVYRLIQAGDKACLILDEVTHATPAVQAAILDMVNEKMIDGVELPKKLAVIMLGNKGGDDGTFAGALSTALINRCMKYTVSMASIPEWIEFVKPRKELATFVENYDLAAYYVPAGVEEQDAPSTTPRSLDLFNRAIAGLDLKDPEDIRMSIIIAGGLLHSSTVELWEAYIAVDQLIAAKLWKCDANEWAKYEKVEDPTLKVIVFKDIASLAFGIDYAKTNEQREEIKPKLTKFLQHLLEAESSTKDGKLVINDVATATFNMLAKQDTQLFMGIELKNGKEVIKAATLLDGVWTATFKGKGKK